MKILQYIFILVGLMAISSCEDYFGEGANIDPDNPTTVTASVILPQVQARLVYTYGGDFTRYVGLYTQHVDGISRQFAVLGQYGIIPSDTDTPWSNIYTGTLNSNRELYRLATDNGFNHYAGISRAIEAYAVLVATDLWGDIPYSTALDFASGGDALTPTFDSQESIYTDLLALIGEARGLLSGADDSGNAPGSDDLIYGGDIGKWVKFCNVLEARLQLHKSKVDASAYSNVMAALNRGGFDNAGDGAGFAFGTPASENAPWFQYVEQRDDCEVGATYVGMLANLNDPRMATYGQPHTNDHPIWTKDQTVNVLSYTEQEFMKAEALLGTDSGAAYAAYLSGIAASMEEAQVSGADADAYVAQSSVGVGASSLTLNDVMTQKYLALYTDPEVFSDWRRTNLPALTPVTGNEIPRRLPYSQAEILSNPNVPSTATTTIYSRVWWDN